MSTQGVAGGLVRLLRACGYLACTLWRLVPRPRYLG